MAWYSNASGNIGIYLLQLDPATGGPLAGAQPTKVPQSESPANNGFHLALACAAACRIVYGAQTAPAAPLRLASWAPGEGGPTNIGGGARLSLGLPLTAAYRADGRLWVAWYDLGTTKGFYAAKLGNAKGAGGTVQNLGRPGRRLPGRAQPRLGGPSGPTWWWPAPSSPTSRAARSGPPTSRTRRRSSRTLGRSGTGPRP